MNHFYDFTAVGCACCEEASWAWIFDSNTSITAKKTNIQWIFSYIYIILIYEGSLMSGGENLFSKK